MTEMNSYGDNLSAVHGDGILNGFKRKCLAWAVVQVLGRMSELRVWVASCV